MKVDLSNAQRNDAGQVAMTYYMSTNPLVEFQSPYRGYKFITKVNICLAWVNESDVEKILSILGGCCGKNNNRIFRISSAQEVRLWEGKADR